MVGQLICIGRRPLGFLNSYPGNDGEVATLKQLEIPFMQLQQFPSEKQQTKIYRDLFEEFAGQPVTIRTLDVGGDKQLDYFPIIEENPFLGWRGIRVTLDHPEIFLVQLRAIFKASVGFGQLKIADLEHYRGRFHDKYSTNNGQQDLLFNNDCHSAKSPTQRQ